MNGWVPEYSVGRMRVVGGEMGGHRMRCGMGRWIGTRSGFGVGSGRCERGMCFDGRKRMMMRRREKEGEKKKEGAHGYENTYRV